MKRFRHIVIALFFCVSLVAGAQFSSFFNPDKEGKSGGPTRISANEMDIDLKNNIILLTGNVEVDDKNHNITADKTTVHLLKNAKSEAQEVDVSRIVAEGNVVILKKAISEEQKKRGEQKITSAKADYDLKSGVIEFSGNCVCYQGGSYMEGDQIIVYRDEDRIIVKRKPDSDKRVNVNINTDDRKPAVAPIFPAAGGDSKQSDSPRDRL